LQKTSAAGIVLSMCLVAPTLEEIEKVNRNRWLGQRNRKVNTRANGLEVAVTDWLERYARRRLKDVRSTLDNRGIKALRDDFSSARKPVPIAKISDKDLRRFESELLNLLTKFGLKQLDSAGRDSANSVGGTWILRPQVKAQMNAQLANKVVLLVKETELSIKGSIRQLVTDALLESPQPSPKELGRRIARQWMGPGEVREPQTGKPKEGRVTTEWRRSQEKLDREREHIFSYTRAQTIARTELAQADNAGIAEGLTVSGVESVKWLARGNDGRSGPRKHYLMNRHKSITVAEMNGRDKSKWFELDNGERAPYPNWIGLSAFNTVSCRCVLVPAR
jgi:uncharacterized protein YajQ (UPF0234 family)